MFQSLILSALLFSFSAFAQAPLKPDLVILTEELSEMPSDIVNKSFLSKILSKEKVFKYQDEPGYFQVQGFLKRIAFEHDVTTTDNIIKYLLEMPAEIAFWKGSDGKLHDFTFTSQAGKIKETVATFLLNVANIASDTQVTSFKDGEHSAFTLKFGSKSLTVSSREGMISITTLGVKFLPWNITEGNESWKKGFYSSNLKSDLGKNRHRMIFSGEYITLGYQYFFPHLEAVSFTFDKSNWSVATLMTKHDGKLALDATPLWKVLPLSPAMCLVVPLAPDRVATLLDDSKDPKQLNPADLEEMIASPVGVCWYEDSSLFTPVFAMKTNNIPDIKEKLKSSFEKYIGQPPVTDETTKFTESSMKVNDRKNTFELTKEVTYQNDETYRVKLALKNDFIIFSPDEKLVVQSIATADGKGTAVGDELKDKKELSVLFSPFRISGLLETYLNDALPSGQESVFRASLESYFMTSFKNLATVKPFVLSMPKTTEAEPKWEELGMNDL